MKQKKLALAIISALSVMAQANAQSTSNNKEIELPRIDVVGNSLEDIKKNTRGGLDSDQRRNTVKTTYLN